MIDYLVMILIGIGLVMMLLGSIGLLRFPDFYSRMHPPTKTTTMGITLLIIASMIYLGYEQVGLKALLVTLFLFLTAPVSAHILSRAAYRLKVPFWEKTHCDELKGHLTHVQMEENVGELLRHEEQQVKKNL